MSTYTVLDLDAIKNAVHNGGAAGLTDYVTDDVELTQIDQRTPPASPARYTGRDALAALAEELERRGIRMTVDETASSPPTAARCESCAPIPTATRSSSTRC
jgi:hypothetical protein